MCEVQSSHFVFKLCCVRMKGRCEGTVNGVRRDECNEAQSTVCTRVQVHICTVRRPIDEPLLPSRENEPSVLIPRQCAVGSVPLVVCRCWPLLDKCTHTKVVPLAVCRWPCAVGCLDRHLDRPGMFDAVLPVLPVLLHHHPPKDLTRCRLRDL